MRSAVGTLTRIVLATRSSSVSSGSAAEGCAFAAPRASALFPTARFATARASSPRLALAPLGAAFELARAAVAAVVFAPPTRPSFRCFGAMLAFAVSAKRLSRILRFET